METTREIMVNLSFSNRKAVLFLSFFFIAWHPGFLGSETLTLTTYYPAPYGGYVGLLTTGGTAAAPINTVLARTAGAGNVLIGMATQAAAPVPQSKLDVNGSSRSSGEITGTMSDGVAVAQFRAISGNFPAAMIRNDGTNTYMPLFTNSGSPYSGWNGLRPLYVNNTSGDVSTAGGQVVTRHSDGAILMYGSGGIAMSGTGGIAMNSSGGIAFNGTGGITGLCRTVPFGMGWSNTCNGNETPVTTYGDGVVRMCGMFQAGGALNVGTQWTRYCFGGDWAGSLVCCRMK